MEGQAFEPSGAGQVLDHQPVGASGMRGARRIGQSHLPPNHHGDQLFVIDLIPINGANHLAILQHRDAVGDCKDFRQAVGDKDHRRPVLLELADDGEEMLYLGSIQRGGWLVQNEHGGVGRQCPRNLDELAFGNGEVANRRVERDRHAEAIEN